MVHIRAITMYHSIFWKLFFTTINKRQTQILCKHLYYTHLYIVYIKAFLAVAPSVHVFAVTHPDTPSRITSAKHGRQSTVTVRLSTTVFFHCSYLLHNNISVSWFRLSLFIFKWNLCWRRCNLIFLYGNQC